MKTFLILLTLAGALAISARAQDAATNTPAPRTAVIPKLKGKLTIDGKLDEPVWQKAAMLKPFTPNRGEGKDSEGTEVRVWYDDDALHLGWVCQDVDIQATFTNRDSKFWEEEVVEFFIAPDKLEQYFELQWNPLGGVFDAIIKNELGPDGLSKKFTGDWSYTATGMRSAVKVDGTVANSADTDKQWTVEVTVPFTDLGVKTPEPGTKWRGNFYRFSRGKNNPEQQLAWSPTRLPSFHQPSRFGYLEFGR